jgi:hypothetical protein
MSGGRIPAKDSKMDVIALDGWYDPPVFSRRPAAGRSLSSRACSLRAGVRDVGNAN